MFEVIISSGRGGVSLVLARYATRAEACAFATEMRRQYPQGHIEVVGYNNLTDTEWTA